MTTKEVMNLDYREEENQEIIQKVLRQIKPLSRYSDECEIPFEAIEKAIVVMSKKYNMELDKLKELISEPELENIKKEMAFTKTIEMLANNAVVK